MYVISKQDDEHRGEVERRAPEYPLERDARHRAQHEDDSAHRRRQEADHQVEDDDRPDWIGSTPNSTATGRRIGVMISSADVGSRSIPRQQQDVDDQQEDHGLSVRPTGPRRPPAAPAPGEDPAQQRRRPDDEHDLGGDDRGVPEDQRDVADAQRPVRERQQEHVQAPMPAASVGVKKPPRMPPRMRPARPSAERPTSARRTAARL